MLEHQMKVIHNLRAAEQILALYLGPTTTIRRELTREIDERMKDLQQFTDNQVKRGA